MLIKLVFALQLQCGIQQLGPHIISYGALVYTEEGSTIPQLGYFESTNDEFAESDLCSEIKVRMDEKQYFRIQLHSDAKKIIDVIN